MTRSQTSSCSLKALSCHIGSRGWTSEATVRTVIEQETCLPKSKGIKTSCSRSISPTNMTRSFLRCESRTTSSTKTSVRTLRRCGTRPVSSRTSVVALYTSSQSRNNTERGGVEELSMTNWRDVGMVCTQTQITSPNGQITQAPIIHIRHKASTHSRVLPRRNPNRSSPRTRSTCHHRTYRPSERPIARHQTLSELSQNSSTRIGTGVLDQRQDSSVWTKTTRPLS